MFINQKTLALWCVTSATVSAFSTPDCFLSTTKVSFVARTVRAGRSLSSRNAQHGVGCPCPTCVGTHPASCMCPGCSSTSRRITMLFAENVAEADGVESEEVPAEVVAMDGVESEDEAHNVDRPARQQLKKKKPKGKELSEFEVGSTVQGIVRSLATYGAFVDIGATTDGLLHISQLSTEYVGNVNDVLKEGQEVEVRIVNIDNIKGQVALSLMTVAEEATAKEAAQEAREARQARSSNNNNNRPSNRRESNAVLSSLMEKGWDTSAMVEGTVVSTVDFGCFVRIDASKLNSECEGEFDGLVHISALQSGRVGSVTDVVNPNDTVQVRVKSIDGNKVALSMLSVGDEEAKVEERAERGDSGDARPREGAANWKEILIDFDSGMPTFQNLALVDDRRQ